MLSLPRGGKSRGGAHATHLDISPCGDAQIGVYGVEGSGSSRTEDLAVAKVLLYEKMSMHYPVLRHDY